MFAMAPTPTVTRIPRTVDGCTWYASAKDASGDTIGASARTKRDVLVRFSEQWERFTP